MKDHDPSFVNPREVTKAVEKRIPVPSEIARESPGSLVKAKQFLFGSDALRHCQHKIAGGCYRGCRGCKVENWLRFFHRSFLLRRSNGNEARVVVGRIKYLSTLAGNDSLRPRPTDARS